MTDSLEGLSAELRKAVRLIRDCHDCGNSLCQNNSHTIITTKMLPAGLVAKEQRIIKALVDNIIKDCLKDERKVITDWEQFIESIIEKVEEAFGK